MNEHWSLQADGRGAVADAASRAATAPGGPHLPPVLRPDRGAAVNRTLHVAFASLTQTRTWESHYVNSMSHPRVIAASETCLCFNTMPAAGAPE